MYFDVNASEYFADTLLSFYQNECENRGLNPSNQNLWFIKGYFMAKHEFNLYPSACECMGDMYACFFAGKQLNYDNECLNVKKIEQDIFAEYSTIISLTTDENERVRELLKCIDDLFEDKLFLFEHLNERISLRLSSNDLVLLNSVAGKSYSDKMRSLLRYWWLNEF